MKGEAPLAPSDSVESPGPASHWAGEPVRVLRERWRVPELEAHATLGSTNDRLKELAEDGAEAFTVVVSEEQTSGRGRGGRSWASPAGAGVWMSVLLPGEAPGRAPLTPMLVGVAVCRAIREHWPGVDVGLKWPNDVVVGERKLCGILCESAPGGGTVAGVGINVRDRSEALPAEVRQRATSLEAQAGGGPVERVRLVGSVLDQLRALAGSPPESLTGPLAAEVAELDRLRGRRIESPGGVVGRGAGIDASGALLVDPGGGDSFERVVAGSVTLLPEVEP